MTELVRNLRKKIGDAAIQGNNWAEVDLLTLQEAVDTIEWQEASIGHFEMNEARLTAPVEEIRAEAIKRFAKVVKDNMTFGYGDEGKIIYESNFDFLVEDATNEAHS